MAKFNVVFTIEVELEAEDAADAMRQGNLMPTEEILDRGYLNVSRADELPDA